MGFGGDITLDADIQHSGFLPGVFFDSLASGGGDFILGVTFTLLWQDDEGNFTDIDNSGKLHFSPRAVMNAAYSGVQRELKPTDHSGHCSNWSVWPNL